MTMNWWWSPIGPNPWILSRIWISQNTSWEEFTVMVSRSLQPSRRRGYCLFWRAETLLPRLSQEPERLLLSRLQCLRKWTLLPATVKLWCWLLLENWPNRSREWWCVWENSSRPTFTVALEEPASESTRRVSEMESTLWSELPEESVTWWREVTWRLNTSKWWSSMKPMKCWAEDSKTRSEKSSVSSPVTSRSDCTVPLCPNSS